LFNHTTAIDVVDKLSKNFEKSRSPTVLN